MTALILGWGITGKSIARHLNKFGMDYKVWDDYKELLHEDVNLLKNDLIEENINNIITSKYNSIFISPGIPPTHDVPMQAEASDILISTDIDIYFDQLKKQSTKFIGITGTNGKTTCAELLKKLLIKAGFNVETCGNVGMPILDLIDSEKLDYLILELSSFQLHYAQNIRLDYAVIVNISEDHIDWHGTDSNYILTKLSITNFLPKDIKPLVGTTSKEVDKHIDSSKYEFVKDLAESNLYISNDIQNVLYGLCRILDIDNSICTKTIQEAESIPHRFEIVGQTEKYCFINDSKATNFAAVTAALAKVDKGLLILHGDTKSVDSSQLVVHDGIHSVVHYGETSVIDSYLPKNVFSISSFEELPLIIDSECELGDTIILSPGGSSFDNFDNYEDRGNQYKKVIYDKYLKVEGDGFD